MGDEIEMKVLDLFCGGGGATKGMQLSKFPIKTVGVDIKDQPDYCGDEFIKKSVFDLELSFLREFDFIWASPTCQVHTFATSHKAKEKYKNQIPQTRELLVASGKPFCIENVPLAPLRKDLLLCGEMFGLRVIRHRVFECERFKVNQPDHPKHKKRIDKKHSYYSQVAGHGGDSYSYKLEDWQRDIGCDWISDKKTLVQIVPPKYSQYIFEGFIENDL